MSTYEYPYLTPELLDYFFEQILSDKESVKLELQISGTSIYSYWAKLYSLGHTKWHIEITTTGQVLWRRSTWLITKEKREKDQANRTEYNRILEERREAFNRIRLGICVLLGIDPNDPENLTSVNKLAEKALEAKSQGAKDLTGVDLDNVPDLPNKLKHQVMGGGYNL